MIMRAGSCVLDPNALNYDANANVESDCTYALDTPMIGEFLRFTPRSRTPTTNSLPCLAMPLETSYPFVQHPDGGVLDFCRCGRV